MMHVALRHNDADVRAAAITGGGCRTADSETDLISNEML